MRKSISPRVTIAVIIIVVLIVGYLFVKKAQGPGKRTMVPGVGLVDVKTGQPVEGQRGRRMGR